MKAENQLNVKRIQKLSIELANQIAAGEVVERPFSVLKELLENSIDAGSTQIDITIERGGIGLIRVQDNGGGIRKEDLELALSQHATSKILSFTDLEGVNSFGFRGEALASIASVSRLSLSSYVEGEGQETGFRIQKEGRGERFTLSPAPKLPGTTVEVRDLFYNTPARRKFLRSDKTETLYLEEIFKKIALSHPDIAFSYQLNDKEAKRLPACGNIQSKTRRIGDLCGTTFIKTAQCIEAESNGLTLKGWLGSPQHLRAQADLQYFYVNGRNVRDKVVSHAMRQAYEAFGETKGKYPAFILFFDLDPEAVDVNVHPTKHEVRFREARTVHAFLTYSIQEGLSKTKEGGEGEQNGNWQGGKWQEGKRLGEPREVAFHHASDKERVTVTVSENISENLSAVAEISSASIMAPKNTLCVATEEALEATEGDPEKNTPLTLLGGEFLVVEQGENLAFYDIKKVKEYLILQQLKEELKQGLLTSKPLLMPVRLLMSIQEEDMEVLKSLGFDISELGPNSILIRSVPAVIKNISVGFESMMQVLMNVKTIEKMNLKVIEKMMSVIAQYVVSSEPITFDEGIKVLNNYQNHNVYHDHNDHHNRNDPHNHNNCHYRNVFHHFDKKVSQKLSMQNIHELFEA